MCSLLADYYFVYVILILSSSRISVWFEINDNSRCYYVFGVKITISGVNNRIELYTDRRVMVFSRLFVSQLTNELIFVILRFKTIVENLFSIMDFCARIKYIMLTRCVTTMWSTRRVYKRYLVRPGEQTPSGKRTKGTRKRSAAAVFFHNFFREHDDRTHRVRFFSCAVRSTLSFLFLRPTFVDGQKTDRD